ncbi:MAG: RNA 2',3'-cyclic phosphodiesterase [Clostridia bacterium]|nr:RNA 2',3'-cyclic phosphodiesterase [Clostridia bacterium]
MRLFTAIQPSPGFRAALEDLQQRLRETGVTGKYREADGLHLTLAFIGEWPEDITELLPVVRKPFSVTLSHLGIFPEANVLWAGVDPCEELDLLAKQVRHRLADAGIPFDRKGFNPHITLARKPFVPEKVILSEIQVPRVSMIVDDVCLYRSDRGKDGMVYTVIGNSSENADL